MPKKCRKCGSSVLEYQGRFLEEEEEEMACFKHLKNREIYKCLKCGKVNDFKKE